MADGRNKHPSPHLNAKLIVDRHNYSCIRVNDSLTSEQYVKRIDHGVFYLFFFFFIRVGLGRSIVIVKYVSTDHNIIYHTSTQVNIIVYHFIAFVCRRDAFV